MSERGRLPMLDVDSVIAKVLREAIVLPPETVLLDDALARGGGAGRPRSALPGAC